MLTLGIETSGTAGSVALAAAGGLIAETELSPSGRRHARTLVAELKALFRRADCRPAECECVAVSVGPGSFTGLRVGVVCAKTFAYATGCRLVAADTLQVIAAASPPECAQVRVLVDAMRGDVFHAVYERHGGLWRRQGEIRLDPWRELARIHVDVPLSGPALVAIPPSEWPAPRLPPDSWPPRARHVAVLGMDGMQPATDLWQLEPLYIRKSAAEEKADQAGRSRVSGTSGG